MVSIPLDDNDELPSVAVPSLATDDEADQQTTGECIYSSFIMNCVMLVLSILLFITIISIFYLKL